MAECGGSANTKAEYDFSFRYPNSLPSGGGYNGTCYNTVTTTVDVVKTQQKWVANCLNGFCQLGGSPMPDSGHFETTQVVVKEERQALVGTSYTLYPFNIEVEGHMEMFFRTVNAENHLIVRITEARSTLTGTTGNTITAPLYMGINFSYALAATTVAARPTENSGLWKKCLGGWWSAGVACNSGCYVDAYGNPPGGTMYKFGSWVIGTPFEKNGQRPGRINTNLEWDLGKVGNDAVVYIYGRMMQGGNGCNSFRGDAATIALAYQVPPINVCPPEIINEEEVANICDECVDHTVNFEANDLLGIDTGKIMIEYVMGATNANTANWSAAKGVVEPIAKNQPFSATLPCLAPNTRYCLRAKIALDSSYTAESEYTYSCFITRKIPDAKTVVDDFTNDECEMLKNCEYIPQYGDGS